MTTVTAFRYGRHLLAFLWAAGLGGLTASALGWLPRSPLLVGAIALGLCITIAIGVLSQRSGFFARPIVGFQGAVDQLALTFDDGPDEEFTPRILDQLARAGQRATFFVIGARARQHPELLARMVAEGHEVGNHTAAHAWHTALWRPSRVEAEIAQASAWIEEACGVRPTVFRSPAALLSPRIARGAARAGLRLVGLSMRAGDGSPVISAELAFNRLRRGLRSGAILVLHDARIGDRAPTSVEVLPRLCEEMRRLGLKSVPVGELIAMAEGGGKARA